MPDADCAEADGADGASSKPVFDPRVLSDMFGEEPAIVAAVLETFADSMTASLTEVDAALEQDDAATLVSLAHKIKGAAQMSGALALAQAAIDLERAVRAGSKAHLRHAASRVELQWTLLRDHPALHKGIEPGDGAA